MTAVSCPACGAGIIFRSKATVYLVCEHCSSLVVRQDLDLTLMGKVAELLDELTPLQIGTTGTFKGRSFTLVGRLQREWDGGFWSEWHALHADMSSGWLAQAEGELTMTWPENVPSSLPSAASLRSAGPGLVLRLGSKEFQVTDTKTSRIRTYEGELPAEALRTKEVFSLDFGGPDARFATIELDETGGRSLFVGEGAAFEDFRFGNLRAVDGW